MVAEKFGPRQPNHRREPVGSEATHGRRLDPPVEHPVLPRIVRTGATPGGHVDEGDAPMAAATEGQFGSHCQARPEFGESVKARQNGLCASARKQPATR